MRIRDVMTPNPTTIGPNESLYVALQKMATVGRRLPVVANGELVGVITDRDLRLAMNSPHVLREKWEDEYLLRQSIVEEFMTVNPVTVTPDMPVVEAADLILKGHFSGLPVVDEQNRVVGVVTVTDLIRTLAELLTKDAS